MSRYDLPLSREEFADALRKGKGRVVAHVRAHGDVGIEDLLLDATSHSWAHDQQSEGHRGAWMVSLLSLLPDQQRYFDAALAAFAESQDSRDVEQLAGMVETLATNGFQGARQGLYERFDREGSDNDWLSIHLIELDGLEGLLHVARVLGRRLGADPDFWLDWSLTNRVDEELGAEGDEALRRAAAVDPDVQRFLAELRKEESPSPPRPWRGLDHFLGEVEKGERQARVVAGHFARGAGPADLQRLAGIVSAEADPVRRARLLRPFRFVDPPGGSAFLLPFARSAYPAVREVAIDALAEFSNDAVAVLSADLLDGGSLEGIRLLGQNYHPGQFAQLERLLPRDADAERLHGLGMDIIAVGREGLNPEAEGCLVWLHEQTPCSFCRHGAVTDLIEIGKLPADVAAECRDDCNHEIRSAVAALA